MKKNCDGQMCFAEFNVPSEDCVWYDVSPSGEECCALHKIPLEQEECPCFFCKDYSNFKMGTVVKTYGNREQGSSV